MGKKILSLFLALSVTVSVINAAAVTAFAEVAALYTVTDGIVLTTGQYDAELEKIAGGADAADFADNEEYVNTLLRRKLVEKAGYETLAARMNEDIEFKECIEWLFTDTQMLRYYVYGSKRVKVMLWNSLSGMTPKCLYDGETFPQTNME